jgi:P-type Mg2+ transporter
LLTFGFLILIAGAGEQRFQTAWFVESLLTELLIVFVIRTRKRFWRSRPARLLAGLTALVIAIAFALPFLPVAGWFGFGPLPASLMIGLVAISLLLTKRWFFQFEDRRRSHLPHKRRRAAPRRRPAKGIAVNHIREHLK